LIRDEYSVFHRLWNVLLSVSAAWTGTKLSYWRSRVASRAHRPRRRTAAQQDGRSQL